MSKKQGNKYYFSVEGETEKWYFDWLQKTINQTDKATRKVNFDCKIETNPLKRVRSLNIMGKTELYHISDYESKEVDHEKAFKSTMDKLKKAESSGKQIKYKFGYSNFTFDLWIILHKSNCNPSFSHRKQYIKPINAAYKENFEDMDDYKSEASFAKILNNLNINDVVSAVKRSKAIMQRNRENGYILYEYKGYKYYKENPALMIWEPVEKILLDCGLM